MLQFTQVAGYWYCPTLNYTKCVQLPENASSFLTLSLTMSSACLRMWTASSTEQLSRWMSSIANRWSPGSNVPVLKTEYIQFTMSLLDFQDLWSTKGLLQIFWYNNRKIICLKVPNSYKATIDRQTDTTWMFWFCLNFSKIIWKTFIRFIRAIHKNSDYCVKTFNRSQGKKTNIFFRNFLISYNWVTKHVTASNHITNKNEIWFTHKEADKICSGWKKPSGWSAGARTQWTRMRGNINWTESTTMFSYLCETLPVLMCEISRQSPGLRFLAATRK